MLFYRAFIPEIDGLPIQLVGTPKRDHPYNVRPIYFECTDPAYVVNTLFTLTVVICQRFSLLF